MAALHATEASTYGDGSSEMRVLLSTYDSRGGVEPLVALAVRLRALVGPYLSVLRQQDNWVLDL
jgi:hypothetical protein